MDQPQRTLVDGLAAHAAAGPASDATSTALPPALMSPAVLARLIQKKDVRRVKALLAAGLDPNSPDPATGMLPIVMAVGYDDTAMLTALLEAGADINAPTVRAGTTTALSYAVANYKMDAIKVLLDAGADPNVPGEEGGSVLMEVVCGEEEEVALMLIAAGAGVNPTDGSIPPLYVAAATGPVRIVSALLAAGASATTKYQIQDAAHQSPSTAPVAGHQETGQSTAADACSMVQALVPSTPGNERGAAGGHSGTGSVSQAAQWRREALQDFPPYLRTFSAHTPDGPTALDMAAAAGWPVVVAVMLSQQPHPSAQALSSALVCAATHLNHPSEPSAAGARKGSQGASSAPIRDHLRVMELLLEAGADPDLQAHAGARRVNTPLMNAVAKDNLAAVRLLLRAGADVNAVRHGGATALLVACMLGHTAVVKELLSAGASIHTDGDTQFLQVCKVNNAEIFDLLLAAGMDIMPDPQGILPLAKAAVMGADAVVGRLLSAGASVDQTDLAGLTALFHASSLTADERAQGRLRAVKVLLAAGADPNARHGLHRPLSAAVLTGNVEAVHVLLAGGADPNMPNRGDVTPLQEAAAAGHESVVAALLAAGADPRPALASVEARTQPTALGAVGVRKLLREACDRLDAAALAERLAAELIAEEEEERGGSSSTVARGQGKSRGKNRAKGRQSQQPAAPAAPGMAPGGSRGDSGVEVVVEGGRQTQSAGVLPVAASGRVDVASPSPLVQLEELQVLTLSSSQLAAHYEGLTAGWQAESEVSLDRWCVVCMERRHNTVLVPCAHAVMCTGCCDAVQAAKNECPMCREPIEAVLQLQV